MTLTKIQIQERARRKRERLKMRGLPTPPGTRPREYHPVAEAAWKPMPTPFDLGSVLTRLNLMLNPWFRRRYYKGVPRSKQPPEAR